MATLTLAQATARLKALTGQASTANAVSRARLMDPRKLAASGLDGPILDAIVRGGAKSSNAGNNFSGIVTGGPAKPDTASIQSYTGGQDNSRIGTATNLTPTNPLSPLTAKGGAASINSFIPKVYNPTPGAGSANAAEHDAGTGIPDSTGYAPTLAQEQAQAQNNANAQGDFSTYVPNPPAGTIPSGTASSVPDLITKIPTVMLPDAPNIHIGWHDFTTQANAKAAAAYAPLYTALTGAETNAKKQANDAGAQVKGMYANLDTATAKDKANTAANYAAQAAAAKAAGRTTSQQIGDTYNSSAKDIAAIMAQAGLGNAQGTAAADTIATTANQRSDAQTNAATAAAENEANIKAQGANQADFLTNTMNADRTTGIATREGITRDLGNVLQQYANQRLSTKGDQLQQALTLNQQMGQNDFGAQTASASQANSQFANAMSRATFQQNAGMNAVNLQNQGILNQQNRAAAAAAAEQAAAIAQMNYNEKIYGDNVTLAGKQIAAGTAQGKQDSANTNATLDRASREAIAAMHLNATNPNSPENLAASNAYSQWEAGLYGIAAGSPDQAGTAKTLESFIMDQAKKQVPDSGGQINYIDFMEKAVKAAQENGVPVTADQVRRAATQYQRLMQNRALLLNNPQPVTTYGGTTATSGG